MSASACSVRAALAALVLVFTACGEPAAYRFGTNLSGLRFAAVSPMEGVYPSTAVLNDPLNPFAAHGSNLRGQPDGGIGTKWQLLASVGGVPAFYAFATALTQEPTGENQFYTAQMLGEIALSGAYAETMTEAQVRSMAIAGYQSTLDNFPNAVSYYANGISFFSLDVLAYQGLTGLGGTPRGWALLQPADGGLPSVVRTAEYIAPDGGH